MSKIIARRKGYKIRVFDTERAKMGPWQDIPQPSPYWLKGAEEQYGTMTVPELRIHASWLGLAIPTRMRKADLLEVMSVRAYFRSFAVGKAHHPAGVAL